MFTACDLEERFKKLAAAPDSHVEDWNILLCDIRSRIVEVKKTFSVSESFFQYNSLLNSSDSSSSSDDTSSESSLSRQIDAPSDSHLSANYGFFAVESVKDHTTFSSSNCSSSFDLARLDASVAFECPVARAHPLLARGQTIFECAFLLCRLSCVQEPNRMSESVYETVLFVPALTALLASASNFTVVSLQYALFLIVFVSSISLTCSSYSCCLLSVFSAMLLFFHYKTVLAFLLACLQESPTSASNSIRSIESHDLWR